jgi:hypothetical protein
MARGSVTTFVPDVLIDEYRQRGVFTDMVTAVREDTKHPPVRCSRYTISLKLAYQMYEDAMEQRANRAPTTDSELYREYGRLLDMIGSAAGINGMDCLAWAPGWKLRPRRWKRAESYVIYLLFAPLGIGAAETAE